MFFVVVQHVLGHGGVIKNTTGLLHNVFLILNVLTVCAVDCYAIASGYVGVKSKPFRYSIASYLKLWIAAAFYSILMSVIYYILNPDSFTMGKFFKCLFPVAGNQYWYFTAFTGLFVAKPWINCVFTNGDKKDLTKLTISLVCAFIILPAFAAWLGNSDLFHLSGGYCTFWVIILYCLGAWLSKCNVAEKIRVVTSNLVIICCYFVIVAIYVLGQLFDVNVSDISSYTSPIVVLIAAMYVIAFSNIKVKGVVKELVKFLSPAAFGVYLIHDNRCFREMIISKVFSSVTVLSSGKAFLFILGITIGIYLICLCIEKGRLTLFHLLRIDEAVNHLSDLIRKKFNAWFKRLILLFN